eukprot:2940466-Prorocentrum_lima.AAC.1
MGANIHAAAEDGSTPLVVATSYGKASVAKLLLGSGADFCLGLTPLHIAASGGDLDEARALIDKGAEVDAVLQDRWTPLDLACQSDC